MARYYTFLLGIRLLSWGGKGKEGEKNKKNLGWCRIRTITMIIRRKSPTLLCPKPIFEAAHCTPPHAHEQSKARQGRHKGAIAYTS